MQEREVCSVKIARNLENENAQLRALVTTERVRCQELENRVKELEEAVAKQAPKKRKLKILPGS